MILTDISYLEDKKRISFSFTLDKTKHTAYVQIDQKTFEGSFVLPKTIDFLIPYLGLLALTRGENLDLQSQRISSNALKTFDVFQRKFIEWLPHLFPHAIAIQNYTLEDIPVSSKGTYDGMFFSLGVDSFDSLIDVTKYNHNSNLALFNVKGLDIHENDTALYTLIEENIKATSKKYATGLFLVSTNLREIMEHYISWTYGHGVVLHTLSMLFTCFFKNIYIPGTVRIDQLAPHGSHPEIDEIWSTTAQKIIHHGSSRRRIDKVIENISQDDFAIQHLNVCYKNVGGFINCGVCHKCVITKLEFYIARILEKSNFRDKTLTPEMVETHILVTTDVGYVFAHELLSFFSKDPLDLEFKKIIEQKVTQYLHTKNTYAPTNSLIQKNKNILFIDFNGVISYKNFWFSLENKDNELSSYLDKIETYLFKNNIQIIKDWMIGKYTSEQIHYTLSKQIDIKYEKILQTFIEDCKKLDISNKILDKLSELRSSYHCILITDNMDSFDRFTLPSNPQLTQSFDKIYNSFSFKRLKADNSGAWFKEIMREYHAEVGNCILIDDSNSNCKAFEALGGQSYRTKTEQEVLDVLDTLSQRIQSKWEWQY